MPVWIIFRLRVDGSLYTLAPTFTASSQVNANPSEVTVQVTDMCPVEGNERWCSGDAPHLDVAPGAFDKVVKDNHIVEYYLVTRPPGYLMLRSMVPSLRLLLADGEYVEHQLAMVAQWELITSDDDFSSTEKFD